MPTVAEIAGFLILIYLKDHGPPHFHVIGKGAFAKIEFETLQVVEVKGTLKASDLRTIRTWARKHLPELYACWAQAQRGEKPNRIKE